MATQAQAYDVVWYWSGPVGRGHWAVAEPECWPEYLTVDSLLQAIRQGGRVAHPGRRSIGPPEGAPSQEELSAVMGIFS